MNEQVLKRFNEYRILVLANLLANQRHSNILWRNCYILFVSIFSLAFLHHFNSPSFNIVFYLSYPCIVGLILVTIILGIIIKNEVKTMKAQKEFIEEMKNSVMSTNDIDYWLQSYSTSIAHFDVISSTSYHSSNIIAFIIDIFGLKYQQSDLNEATKVINSDYNLVIESNLGTDSIISPSFNLSDYTQLINYSKYASN